MVAKLSNWYVFIFLIYFKLNWLWKCIFRPAFASSSNSSSLCLSPSNELDRRHHKEDDENSREQRKNTIQDQEKEALKRQINLTKVQKQRDKNMQSRQSPFASVNHNDK